MFQFEVQVHYSQVLSTETKVQKHFHHYTNIKSILNGSDSGGVLYLDYWWESQRERDRYEDQDVGGWIILGWVLESGMG
jgi:hypothetical protein